MARIPQNAWVIGVFTGLNRGRDFGILESVLEEVGDAYLVVAGTGAQSPAIERLAQTNPRVRYLGFVPDIAPWYGAVDMVLYLLDPASRNARHGFPNNVATAVAAGVPILTNDVGECARLVKQYRLGPIVASATRSALSSAIRRLRSPEEYATYVHNSQSARDRFDWKHSRSTLLAAYRRLFESGDAPEHRATS